MKYIYLAGILTGVMFMAVTVSAAEFSVIRSNQNDIAIGDEFQVTVVLRNKEAPLNTFQGTLVFPDSIAEPVRINEQQSITSMWVTPPNISKKSPMPFSAVIPGGYSGDNGVVLAVVFKAIKAGTGSITVQNGQVYLNTADGARGAAKSNSISIAVSERVSEQSTSTAVVITNGDTTPPFDIQYEITRSRTFFDNQWFIALQAKDTDSGMDHFEIQESSADTPQPEKWIVAERLTILTDQSRKSYVHIKAIDRSGNERVITAPPVHKIWYSNPLLWGILVLLVVAGIIFRLKTKKVSSLPY
jgi:hypothetical protein